MMCSNSKENVAAFSADTEARWGCKRKAEKGRPAKYWFGYKRHVCVDTASGLIEKLAVTPANVNDSNAFGLVCPWGKRILADRGYDTGEVYAIMQKKGCIDRVMRTKRGKAKGFDAERNKWIGRRRSPWEMVFAHTNKRTRYMGLKKTYLQVILEAIVFNMKPGEVGGPDPTADRHGLKGRGLPQRDFNGAEIAAESKNSANSHRKSHFFRQKYPVPTFLKNTPHFATVSC